MNDGFITTSPFMAALLCYLYQWESLLRIDASGPAFHFDIASEDGKTLEEQWGRDEIVVQASTFVKNYVRITGLLKQLHREGKQSWRSINYEEAWIAGKFPDGRRIK